MTIKKYSLGELQANCYFLIEDQNCLIIDPADDASFILEELQRQQLNLVGMLATHGHFDHIGAVGEIQLSLDVPLHIFEEDQFLIDRLGETAKYFLGFDPHFIKPKKINYLSKNKLQVTHFNYKYYKLPVILQAVAVFILKKKTLFLPEILCLKRGLDGQIYHTAVKKTLKNL